MKPARVVRFTNIDAPEDNGCGECLALKNLRMPCERHREGRPCAWCLGRGYTVKENRWSPCGCRANRNNEKEQ